MEDELGYRAPRVELEAIIAVNVAALVARVPVGELFELEPSDDLCLTLERFLPEVLARKYPRWRSESLDGIYVARARVTGRRSIQLVGTAILITDQAVTPLAVEVQLDQERDELAMVRVRIGEAGHGGTLGISGAAFGTRKAEKLLERIADQADHLEWAYEATSGEEGEAG
jgi:hypothetical protein